MKRTALIKTDSLGVTRSSFSTYARKKCGIHCFSLYRWGYLIPAVIGLVSILSSSSVAEDYPTGLKPSGQRYKDLDKREAPPTTDLKPSFSLRDDMPPSGDQSPSQSCAAWAAAYALKSFQEREERHWSYYSLGRIPDRKHLFSPLFVYERTNQGADSGTSLVDTLEFLTEKGCPTMATMAKHSDDVPSKVSDEIEREALKYALRSFYRVEFKSEATLKRFLVKRNPILIGANVDQSFMDLKGEEKWEEFGGPRRFAHAMLLIGYDDTRRAFEVQNSWGPGWGDRGRGWIDYAQFQRSVFEAYYAADIDSSARLHPLSAISAVWSGLVNTGRLRHEPSVQEIEDLFPIERMLPDEMVRKKSFYKALQVNWSFTRKVALLPSVTDWGTPQHEALGNVERYTFKPKFAQPDGNFRATPETLVVTIDIGQESRLVGYDVRARVYFAYDFPSAVPEFLREEMPQSSAASSSPINERLLWNPDQPELSVRAISQNNGDLQLQQTHRSSPNIAFQPPAIAMDVNVNGVPGMAITPRGSLFNAGGRSLGMQIHFTDCGGRPLRAHPMESTYRDISGTVSTQWLPVPVSASQMKFGNQSLEIPYYALNFQPTNFRRTYCGRFVITAFVDGRPLASTQPFLFTVRW